MFVEAQRIYVLGLGGMYPAAFFFHYAAAMFSDKSVLAAGDVGTHLDTLRGIGPKDVAIVFTCRPYPRDTVQAVRFAVDRGARLIAVTDSPVSPVARCAALTIHVKLIQSNLLSSSAANVLVSRVLAAVLLSVSDRSSVARIRRTDEHVAAFEVYENQERNPSARDGERA